MKVFISITDPNGNQAIYQVGSTPRVIGRSETSDIRVIDELTSSRHCQIFLNDNFELIVEDIGSKNGTTFNGVKKLIHTIYVGDEIIFGNSKLQINTEKTDDEALNHLSYKGDPILRRKKEMTLELEMNPQKSSSIIGKSSNKKTSNKPLQEMSAEERARFQQEKIYGISKDTKKSNISKDKNLKLKYHIADLIDFLIPVLILIASMFLMTFLDPDGFKDLLEMNLDKVLDISVLSYPVLGILIALLGHKLNRNNKGGSIGERILRIN